MAYRDDLFSDFDGEDLHVVGESLLLRDYSKISLLPFLGVVRMGNNGHQDLVKQLMQDMGRYRGQDANISV